MNRLTQIITIILFFVATTSLSYAAREITINSNCIYLNDLTASHIIKKEISCDINPGDSKLFPKEVIQNYLRREGINAKVNDDVKVIRTGEKLSLDDLKSYVLNEFHKSYPNLQIVIEQVRTSKDIYAANYNDFTFKVDTVKFGVVYAEVNNQYKKYQVYMYIKAFQKGYVSNTRIKAGDTIKDKVREKLIDVTNFRGTLLTNVEQLISSKMINKGKSITTDIVLMKPALNKGESVKLIYNDGVIVVETVGIIEDNAYEGSIISVRNPISQKVISAKYIGKGVAHVVF